MAHRTAPLFSIVVPCRDERAWLRPGLDSVLDQSWTDLEVIGVDDGSTDGSDRILAEYAEKDARIRTISLSEPRGPGLARNAGIDECRGDYVLFLDGDDTMTSGSLAAIAERIEQTGRPDILLYDYQRVFWDGRVVRNLRHEAFAREGSGVFTAAERPVFLTFLEVVWNKAYRRDFVTGFRFSPGRYQGVPFTYATMLSAERIATLDRTVVHHREHRVLPPCASRNHFDVLDQYQRVFDLIGARPELASWRRFVFDRALDHLLAVLRRPGRLDPADREEFFHRAAGCAARWRPAGYTPDPTRQGFRRGLLVRDDYPAYAALLLGTRVLTGGRTRATTVRRFPGAVTRFAGELPPVRDARSLRTVLGAVRRRVRESVPGAGPRTSQIDPDLAVFAADGFRSYGCSPRAIYERAVELVPNLRGVWLVRHDQVETVPPGVEYAVTHTPAYYTMLSRARYFVNNVNFGDDVRKRDGQVHLQTHRGTPLAATGLDLRHHPGGPDLADLMWRVDRWDYSLSANRFGTEIHERVYPSWFETLEYGLPRNDRLLTATLDEVRAIRADLGCDDGQRVVLYAPIWPGTELDLDKLTAVLGPDSHLLVRRPAGTAVLDKPSGQLTDVSAHDDRTNLLLAADVLITDFSPIMVDYANLDRPIVLLTTDHDRYVARHGSYLDLIDLPPGVVARTQTDLLTAFTDDSYAAPEATKLRHLFRDHYCDFDDGQAATRVVHRVFLNAEPPPITPLPTRTPAPSPYWEGG